MENDLPEQKRTDEPKATRSLISATHILILFATIVVTAVVGFVVSMDHRYQACKSGGENHIWVSRSHTCLVYENGLLSTVEEQKSGRYS